MLYVPIYFLLINYTYVPIYPLNLSTICIFFVTFIRNFLRKIIEEIVEIYPIKKRSIYDLHKSLACIKSLPFINWEIESFSSTNTYNITLFDCFNS